MKKPISLLLIITLLLAMAACGRPAPAVNPPLILAEKYLLDLDYEQALLQFEQAIEIEPKNPRGYVGQMVAWIADPGRPEAPPAWPKLPDLPSLPPVDADPKPEDILPVIFDWYKGHDLPEFLRKLIDALLRQWPEAQWLKDELEKLDGAEKPTEGTTKEDPKAKPPLVRQNSYSADETLTDYYTFEYNSYGTRKRYNSYSADGTPDGYSIYEYNSDGTLRRYTSHSADGTPGGYRTYEYNSDGTLRRQNICDSADGMPSDYFTYEYNSDRTEKRINNYNADGTLSFYYTSEYNFDGTLKRQNWYESDGMLSGFSTYEYSSDGTVTRQNVYDADGTLSSYTTYEYGTW